MTEAIKQWIEKESGAKHGHISFANGLTKGIEIAEGFAPWAWHRYIPDSVNVDTWFNRKDGTPFTTSQLLEKYLIYLKTLEP